MDWAICPVFTVYYGKIPRLFYSTITPETPVDKSSPTFDWKQLKANDFNAFRAKNYPHPPLDYFLFLRRKRCGKVVLTYINTWLRSVKKRSFQSKH